MSLKQYNLNQIEEIKLFQWVQSELSSEPGDLMSSWIKEFSNDFRERNKGLLVHSYHQSLKE